MKNTLKVLLAMAITTAVMYGLYCLIYQVPAFNQAFCSFFMVGINLSYPSIVKAFIVFGISAWIYLTVELINKKIEARSSRK